MVVVGLSGPDVPRVWLTWQTLYLASSPGWLREQMRSVAQRPEVQVSDRGRTVLALADAATGRATLGIWLRSTALFIACIAVVAGAVLAYVLLLIGRTQ